MERTLRLTKNEFEYLDENIFLCPWTIWVQLKAMIAREKGVELADHSLNAATGENFDAWIRQKHDNLAAVVEICPEEFTTESEIDAVSWLSLLQLWSDDYGQLVGELGYFLAQGPVRIEDEGG